MSEEAKERFVNVYTIKRVSVRDDGIVDTAKVDGATLRLEHRYVWPLTHPAPFHEYTIDCIPDRDSDVDGRWWGPFRHPDKERALKSARERWDSVIENWPRLKLKKMYKPTPEDWAALERVLREDDDAEGRGHD